MAWWGGEYDYQSDIYDTKGGRPCIEGYTITNRRDPRRGRIHKIENKWSGGTYLNSRDLDMSSDCLLLFNSKSSAKHHCQTLDMLFAPAFSIELHLNIRKKVRNKFKFTICAL